MHFRFTVKEIENSPSVQDGFFATWLDEFNARREVCDFISEVGKKLKVYDISFGPQVVTSVACVYFHIFYSRQSFVDYNDPRLVAAACLFLAAKVEESRRKISVLIHDWRFVNGEVELSDFQRLRDKIFELERILLETIEYKLAIDLPYAIVKETCANKKGPLKDLPDVEIDAIVKSAWFFVNDCCKTILPLLFDPKTLAMTCIGESIKHQIYQKCEVVPSSESLAWLEAFDINIADYNNAAGMLHFYIDKNDSPVKAKHTPMPSSALKPKPDNLKPEKEVVADPFAPDIVSMETEIMDVKAEGKNENSVDISENKLETSYSLNASAVDVTEGQPFSNSEQVNTNKKLKKASTGNFSVDAKNKYEQTPRLFEQTPQPLNLSFGTPTIVDPNSTTFE